MTKHFTRILFCKEDRFSTTREYYHRVVLSQLYSAGVLHCRATMKCVCVTLEESKAKEGDSPAPDLMTSRW